ncbi:MAG: PKD domain-containing protein [Saprospiraceae bacterium]|nr:PKD domain-containing protein [Saprospiraceae bacterium]
MKPRKLYMMLMAAILAITPLLAGAQTCQANFSFSTNGFMVHFMDQSTSSSPIVSWFWDFDDGTTSTLQNPMHTFPVVDKFEVCLSITTQNGCISQICNRVEICELNVAVEVGQCNANGEAPLVIQVIDIFGNAEDVDISIDGQLLPGSPFLFTPNTPLIINANVVGDGLSHTVVVTSGEVETCTETIQFVVPDCTADCFLSAMNVQLAGGTTHTITVGDNFFQPANTTLVIGDQVHFVWVGDGHSTTSDATTGPDSWNSGVLGIGATYDVQPTNPGTHRYYCIPHGGPGGVGMSGMLIANCPQNTQFSLLVSFMTSLADPLGFNVLIDGVLQPGNPHFYNGVGPQQLSINLPGDGLNHLIEIRDIADPSCNITRNFMAPDCGAAPACNLSVSAQQISGCDSLYQIGIALAIQAINPGADGFNLFVDSIQVGSTMAYDPSGNTTLGVNLPGDGQIHVITAVDVADNTCQGTTTFTAPDCVIPCILADLSANTGVNVTHIVEVQDFQFIPPHLTISAGDSVRWLWTGAVAHTSTSDAVSGPNSWNSGLLGNGASFMSPVLSTGVHPYYCIPHGAPGGIGMSGTILVQANCTNGLVPVTLEFTENGGGFNGFMVWVDSLQADTFPYNDGGMNTVSLLVSGDGQLHTFSVRDVDDANCLITTSLTTPDCNATTCQVAVDAQVSGPCNDGTQIPVIVTVNSLGGSSGGFVLWSDGVVLDTFLYDTIGSTTVNTLLAGDGQPHTFIATDLSVSACSDTISIITPDCELPCQLSNLQIIAAGNGNPTTHTVEVRDFEFVPRDLIVQAGDIVHFVWTGVVGHTSTSDAAFGPNSWNSGLLTNGSAYDVTITEEGFFPYYCIPHGAPGGIGMSGTITAIPPCNNGQVVAYLSFGEVNGSSSFNVNIDGTSYPGNPFNYHPSGQNTLAINLPGDGDTHVVNIQDVTVSGCTIETTFSTPLCPNACQLDLTAFPDGECDENGMVAYQLMVMETNGGNLGFNLFVDNVLYPGSPFAYSPGGMTMLPVSLVGDGLSHTIEVADAPSGACRDTVMVQTLHCGANCSLAMQVMQAGACKSNNQVPYHLMVSAVNPGAMGFIVLVDGAIVPGSPFAYSAGGTTVVMANLPGDGLTHNIVVTDAADMLCQTSFALVTPNCGVACSIANFSAEINVPLLYEVEVRDFSFFPPDISVAVGDTIRFIWTGVVPHTSTSDNMSGADTWNSGLLAQGAVYDVVIQTPGDHPYYCIPHGSPGGIGMSGLIRAFDPCDDGLLAVRVQFFNQNGSFNGFNALLDDNLVTSGNYTLSGNNELIFQIPADGQQHHVRIEDLDDSTCFLHEHLDMPDCENPCFGFDPDFSYQINLLTLEVSFVDHTAGNPNSWMWMFGDGATSNDQHPVHIYQPGTYEVCMAVENTDLGCMELICKTIVLGLTVCEPAFSFDNDGLTLSFNDLSQTSQPINNWIWDLGNGQQIINQQHTTYTYPDLGIYEVCLTIETDSCQAAFCQTIDLSNPCLSFVADFAYTIDIENLTAQFTDLSQGTAHRWLWGFGDGVTSTQQHPSHTYNTPGFYTVCLLIQDTLNSCNEARCVAVNVGVTAVKEPAGHRYELTVFPNPAFQDMPNWSLKGILPSDIMQWLPYRIYNLHGLSVANGRLWTAPITSVPSPDELSPGMYVIEIQSAGAIYRGRIVIQ